MVYRMMEMLRFKKMMEMQQFTELWKCYGLQNDENATVYKMMKMLRGLQNDGNATVYKMMKMLRFKKLWK